MMWEFEGKRYPFAGLDMSTRDIMEFQAEAITFAEPTTIRTFDDLARVTRELVGKPKSKLIEHPDFSVWTVAMLWSAMRAAGADLRFSDMLDWPASRLASIRPIAEPGDQAGEGAGKAPALASGAGNRAERRATKKRR